MPRHSNDYHLLLVHWSKKVWFHHSETFDKHTRGQTRLTGRTMFDDNPAIKMVLGLLAALAWVFPILLAARKRRAQPDWSLPVDRWSTAKFGIWWAGRGFLVLAILVDGIVVSLTGKGSTSGALVLFCFSAAATIGDAIRNRAYW
jgi:hypothetical protein